MSVFQEDTKQISLPEQQIFGFLTPECFSNEILSNAPLRSEALNNAVLQVVVEI